MKYHILLLSTVLLFAACGEEEKPAEATEKAPVSYEGPPENVTQVIGIGRVEPEFDIINLASQDGGVVRRLLIREGDAVKAGMPVLELESSVAAAQLPQIRARAATQGAQLTADEKAVAEAETRLSRLLEHVRQ